jgi:hypothetical protein
LRRVCHYALPLRIDNGASWVSPQRLKDARAWGTVL